MPHLDEHIKALQGDTIGRVYVWNVIDHVEIDHLEEETFSKAWTYFVDHARTVPRDGEGVIRGIAKWPGDKPAPHGGQPIWLQGLKKPADLGDWVIQTLANVMLTSTYQSVIDAYALVAGAAATPTPVGSPSTSPAERQSASNTASTPTPTARSLGRWSGPSRPA